MDYEIQISGFSSHVDDVMELRRKVNKLSNTVDNCTIQLLNADGIAGTEHILHATLHAIKAFERNENIANDLGLEICVRASTQRQISKALDILGIKNGDMNICAVIVNGYQNTLHKLEEIIEFRDDKVLRSDDNVIQRVYGITPIEIKTFGSVSRILMGENSVAYT